MVERARADQYAATTTESLARLAVEQASRAVDCRVQSAMVDDYDNPDADDECEYHRDNSRAAFESLVRCVDELARRALEAAACTCVAIAAYDRGDVERCERHGQRAVEGERR